MTRATAIRLIVIVPTMAIGGFILLASLGVFGAPVRHAGDAPDWIGALIGFVFFGGASAALISVVTGAADQPGGELPAGTPAVVRVVSGALGTAVALGLAIVFVWVGFGPGERHFTGSGAFLGPLVGRALFGLFGLFTFTVVCWMIARRLKRRRSASDSAG
jgi:hypothetical protein